MIYMYIGCLNCSKNLPIPVTLGPDIFSLNKEVVAIHMTLINQPANIIDHIIQVSIQYF